MNAYPHCSRISFDSSRREIAKLLRDARALVKQVS
jgi:hypothetical protein